MYILLSGRPPFDGKNDEEILKAVSNAKANFKLPIFKKVSDQAMDLMQKLLQPNPIKRLDAGSCLNHDWFKKFSKKVDDDIIEEAAKISLASL